MNTNKNLNIDFNLDHLDRIKKEYKQIKKYMRSSIYAIKKIDGNETKVSKLLNS